VIAFAVGATSETETCERPKQVQDVAV
jgi:hypothetical protein